MKIDLFVRFLEDEHASPNTIKAYAADLHHFTAWFEGQNGEQCDDSAVTPTDLRSYRDAMLAANAKATTINRRLATLRRYLAWAVETKTLSTAPKVPKSIKAPQQAPAALDKAAEFALLRAVERGGSLRDIAIFKLLFNSALRVGEVSNLRLEDLHLSAKRGEVLVRYTKGGKTRCVPLNSEARTALRAYLEVRPEVLHDYIFVGQRRHRLGVRGIEALFGKYAYVAKVGRVTPHSARHTVLTRLLRNGTDVTIAASVAGHSNLNTLMRYTKPSKADLANALERIA